MVIISLQFPNFFNTKTNPTPKPNPDPNPKLNLISVLSQIFQCGVLTLRHQLSAV